MTEPFAQPNFQPLDSYRCPLDGQAMVSAGAGTGKTYNIQILVLRLILSGIPIEKILVVTFTNLATGELQERLRNILLKSLAFCSLQIDGHVLSDAEKKTYEQVIPCFDGVDFNASFGLLQKALRDFDFAPISTIHGFCSRALSDNAFESGLRYGLEIRENSTALTNSLICKFYREFVSAKAPETGRFRTLLLKLLGATPEWLATNLKPTFDNPGIPIHWQAREADTTNTLKAIENSSSWTSFHDKLQEVDLDEAWANGLAKDAYACLGSYKLMGSKESPDRLKFAAQLPSPESCMLFLYNDACKKLVERKDKILSLILDGKQFDTPAFAAFLNFAYSIPEENGGSGERPLCDLLQEYKQALLQKAYLEVSKGIEQAKADEGFITYDDILLKLRDCVEDKTNGDKLKAIIHERFRCVIIDEFQDTDANQSAIFKTLFTDDTKGENTTLFFIGDEKQAIYKFRGGDVQTFQNEQQRISQEGHCYTLADNFRSSSDFIDAMNAFFLLQSREGDTMSRTFFDDPAPDVPLSNITVGEIGKGRYAVERYLIDRDNTTHVGNHEGNRQDNRLLSCGWTEDVTQEVAREIHALLNSGIQVKAENQDPTRIAPQDIAILLRSATNAKAFREALAKQGIPSVFMQTQSIFKAKETQWIMTLMDAVMNPGDPAKALQLLATPFFGFSQHLQEILKQKCLQEFQQQLKAWNDIWKNQSFFFMFNDFLNIGLTKAMPSLQGIISEIQKLASKTLSEDLPTCGLLDSLHYPPSRWMALAEESRQFLQENETSQSSFCPISQCLVKTSPEGAHSLAVLMQVAEKLLEISQKNHLGQGALYSFLKAKIQKVKMGENRFGGLLQNANDSDDEDDDKIYPLHLTSQENAVKILTIHKSKGLEFPIVFVPSFGHKAKAERIYHDNNSVRTVNLCDEDEEATKACLREAVEESRRLMYVAITRAKYLCRFVSKTQSNPTVADYPELLLPKVELADDFQISGMPSVGTPPVLPEISSKVPAPVTQSHFTLRSSDLHSGWVTTSFSAIAKEKTPEQDSATETPSPISDDAQNESGELRDFTQNNSVLSTSWTLTPYPDRTPLFQFPGGTRTGTCWHEIFEKLDFTLWKDDAMDDTQKKSWAQVVAQLENYEQLGGEKTRTERLDVFHTMLQKICNATLFAGKVKLCDIPMDHTRREFDFTYRIRKGMTADEVRILLEKDGIAVPADWSHDIGKQNLTGSIDLLFQNPHDELFYILDWKTNILEANAESFTEQNVKKEIDRRFYSFQCVLYALAFVQYYRQLMHGKTLNDSEREAYAKEAYQHFGGCADMLVRGMIATPESSVHYLRPSEELILALDKRIGVCDTIQGGE